MCTLILSILFCLICETTHRIGSTRPQSGGAHNPQTRVRREISIPGILADILARRDDTFVTAPIGQTLQRLFLDIV